jgi:hypothetical protein
MLLYNYRTKKGQTQGKDEKKMSNSQKMIHGAPQRMKPCILVAIHFRKMGVLPKIKVYA